MIIHSRCIRWQSSHSATMTHSRLFCENLKKSYKIQNNENTQSRQLFLSTLERFFLFSFFFFFFPLKTQTWNNNSTTFAHMYWYKYFSPRTTAVDKMNLKWTKNNGIEISSHIFSVDKLLRLYFFTIGRNSTLQCIGCTQRVRIIVFLLSSFVRVRNKTITVKLNYKIEGAIFYLNLSNKNRFIHICLLFYGSLVKSKCKKSKQ